MVEEFCEVPCPYCGEMVGATLDASGGRHQDFIEECPVCCHPVAFHADDVGGDEAHVFAERPA